MSARCRVCHRPLKNPAHIAAGIGPDCAKKAARRASVTDGAQRADYPVAKVERINHQVEQCAKTLAWAQRYREAAYSEGTREQQQQGEWYVRLTTGWYGRWRTMQMLAQRGALRARRTA